MMACAWLSWTPGARAVLARCAGCALPMPPDPVARAWRLTAPGSFQATRAGGGYGARVDFPAESLNPWAPYAYAPWPAGSAVRDACPPGWRDGGLVPGA